MLDWIKNLLFKTKTEQPENCEDCSCPIEEYTTDEYDEISIESLIHGLEYALAQMHMRYEDMAAIIAALLLDKGSTEYVITEDFLTTVLSEGLVVKYEFDSNNNLRVWTELQPESEQEGDFEVVND